MIGQSHVEELVRAHLARLGVEVELGTELVDFEQDESSVRAHVLHHTPQGEHEETISSTWIVSAEGGRSTWLVLSIRQTKLTESL